METYLYSFTNSDKYFCNQNFPLWRWNILKGIFYVANILYKICIKGHQGGTILKLQRAIHQNFCIYHNYQKHVIIGNRTWEILILHWLFGPKITGHFLTLFVIAYKLNFVHSSHTDSNPNIMRNKLLFHLWRQSTRLIYIYIYISNNSDY